MNEPSKPDVPDLPEEDLRDRSARVPDASRDVETSSGDGNSGTERTPQREKIAPDLDPNNTD
jgi:hypothetical protein